MKFNIPVWIYIVSGVVFILLIILFTYLIKKNKARKKCSLLISQIKTSINIVNKEKVVAKYNKLESYKVTNSQNEFINTDITPNVIEYKSIYQELNAKYQSLLIDFDSGKVFNLEPKLDEIRTQFKELQFFAQKIAKNINYVFEEEKDNREIVEILKIKLDAFANTHLEDENTFFYEKLKEKYEKLIEKYTTIENNNNVEYNYLVETSKEIYDEIKVLEDYVLTYPDIYLSANRVFKKLSELNELYENLISENYNLEEIDFEKKYENFVSEIELLINNLVNLEVANDYIITQVDKFAEDCYLRFEDEISAKENLNHKFHQYEKNATYLDKLAISFENEMKEIKKYNISEKTTKTINLLQEQIDLYLDRYKVLVDFVSKSQIDYSRANNDAIDINSNIESLIDQAKELIVISKQTRKDEINAKKELNTLKDALNKILLESLKHNLNQDNVNKGYIQCVVILKKLTQELNKDKINIEEVNKILSTSINKVSDFKQKIKKQLKLKEVAKSTLIYANRYRNTNENDLALSMVERLVGQGLYKRAIENIYAVICRCENVGTFSDFIYTWENRG